MSLRPEYLMTESPAMTDFITYLESKHFPISIYKTYVELHCRFPTIISQDWVKEALHRECDLRDIPTDASFSGKIDAVFQQENLPRMQELEVPLDYMNVEKRISSIFPGTNGETDMIEKQAELLEMFRMMIVQAERNMPMEKAGGVLETIAGSIEQQAKELRAELARRAIMRQQTKEVLQGRQ